MRPSIFGRAERAHTQRPRRGRAVTVAVALLCLLGLAATATSAQAELTTFSATQTIPVPPASNFSGSGGGDGWAVALSDNAVYNVFHHQPTIQVACHLQADASPCAGYPKTVSEPGGSEFRSQGQPGLYLDQKTGKLYVFATRSSDQTGGVVCIDTTSTEADPFCGFTPLTGVGEAPFTTDREISGMSAPMLIGTHWYSFNFAEGPQSGTKNTLSCFDVSTDTACANQPYSVAIGAGNVTTVANLPVGESAAIAGKAIIPLEINNSSRLVCFDDATQSSCGGSWPVTLSFPYTDSYGAPFPLLTAAGATTGLCLPTGIDQCMNLQGESVPTPAGMTGAIPGTEEWNGPSLTLGPRVYVPNGQADEIDCFDYSTGATCAHFPKPIENLELLYTVNSDPQRPTCIWVNADGGSSQIQNFDAYTGEACGQGTIRALASQFVVAKPECTPASYVSVQVLKPARGTYASGTVGFDDGDGNPIGLPELGLDASGSASLSGLGLNTATGLPQFLFTLNEEKETLGAVEVKLTWVGDYTATCIGEKTTVVTPPSSPPAKTATPVPAPKAKAGVLAFGAAHLARTSARACVASNGYLASVTGKAIATVTYRLDGHRLRTLSKANSHGAFSLRVHVAAGKVHHLAIEVKFSSASATKPLTLKKTLARCAAVAHKVPAPRFTG